MNSSHPLDRTLRLIREHLVSEVSDSTIVQALATTRVLIYSDSTNASSHSSQTAIVTTTLLAARCGLEVWLDIPNVPLRGQQPPLRGTHLRDALLDISKELLPGAPLREGRPSRCDAIAVIGNSQKTESHGLSLRLNATDWVGNLGGENVAWEGSDFPLGAMAVGAMAACEMLKLAVTTLRPLARSTDDFDGLFQICSAYSTRLAADTASATHDLGPVDVISAGAVTNAAMFALLRVPGIMGSFRIVEPQDYDLTNMNRCVLMLASSIGRSKAVDIASYQTDSLRISPMKTTLQQAVSAGNFAPLSPAVLVGVDDVPTRWDIQRLNPKWLGIGATSHWSAMASYHTPDLPCARCLHPRNEGDPVELAPTISFVSFWAGLWLAVMLLTRASGAQQAKQQVFVSPNNLHRRFGLWTTPVVWNKLCPFHRPAA